MTTDGKVLLILNDASEARSISDRLTAEEYRDTLLATVVMRFVEQGNQRGPAVRSGRVDTRGESLAP